MRITKQLIDSIEALVDEAVTNSCACQQVGLGNGYLGHNKGCWVHIRRRHYQRVAKFVAEWRKTSGAPRRKKAS